MTTSFNATKDKIGYYVGEAAAGNGAIGLLLLATAEAEATLADRATLTTLLGAAGTAEATFTGYVRKTLATPTRTVDNAGDRVLLGGGTVGTPVSVTWVDAGGAVNNSIVKVVFFYEPESSPADTNRLPLMATDITATTDGNDLVLTLHADGFARVISA